MNNTLSIYGSHDAGAVYIDYTGKIKILEFERFVQRRYAMFSSNHDHRAGLGSNAEERQRFLNHIIRDIEDPDDIKCIVYNELSKSDLEILGNYFPNAIFKLKGHHMAHAASGFYTSGFKNAIILSVDGGGIDTGELGYTKVFHGKDKSIKLIENVAADLGGAYGQIGCPISEIRPGPDDNQHSLSYAGKVMGLCAYGKIRPDWIAPMRHFYQHHSLLNLGNDIGLDLSFNALSGQNSYDLAATSQFVFEEAMFKLYIQSIQPLITAGEPLDGVVIVGGCALNVLFNQILYERTLQTPYKVYIPPNPNDCGLALGQFLLEHPDAVNNTSITYNGFPLLDRRTLPNYKEPITNETEVAKLLKQGKIIGLVLGDSEVGPRALGNRSIICDPSIPGMKDTINAKVKFREWYRPFAPVCRLEDKDKYFEYACESQFMSYAPKVRAEYRTALASVTHADNTSRLQTVTKEQHPYFYNILTALADAGHIPVILNTSFNIKGKPILTTIEDALHVLNTTELDYVVIEGHLFKK